MVDDQRHRASGAPDALRAGTLHVALIQEYDYVPVPVDPALRSEPLFEEIVYLAARSADPLAAHRESP
ncbi:hypothetical protein ACRS6B_24095 [Nocardia asteroides]